MMKKQPAPKPKKDKQLSEDPIKGLKNAMKVSQIANIARLIAEQGFRG